MGFYVKTGAYRGPLLAVVLDWAGTVVDLGSRGPAGVFVDVFRHFGLALDEKTARSFMGMSKKDHVAALLHLPEVSAQWREKAGAGPTKADVDAIYEKIEPFMAETVKRFAAPIPRALEAVEAMRKKGIKIGSSTGYTRSMMDNLVPLAKKNGYRPDAVVCASDVPRGRPAPFMIWENARLLDVYPMEAVVAVGDTVSDIQAGRNAGAWTVGLTLCGNEAGLSKQALAALSPDEKDRLRLPIREKFAGAGAHYTADDLSRMAPILADIEKRLTNGQSPAGGGNHSPDICAPK